MHLASCRELIQKEGGANPFIYVSLTSSCLATSNQWSSFSIGVMWSYFPSPVTIRAAKFWTFWSLAMFFFVVLAHMDEQ